MRRVVSSSEVPHLWAHQTQDSARNSGGTLYFEGKTIYSYGSHFPIATIVENARGETAVLMTTRHHSVTTSSHCSSVASACRHMTTFNVELRRGGDIDIRRYQDQFLADYAERIQTQTEKVARARSHRDWQFGQLTKLVDEANAFCRFFDIQVPPFQVPPSFDELRSELAKRAAEMAAETRREKQALKEKHAQQIEAWKRGEPITLPYSLDDVYLRVEGDEVVTSRGARFPVTHALAGLAVVRRVKTSGIPYRRNGHTIHLGHYPIDSIDVEGNVKAGCHYVTNAEIERIAPELESAIAVKC